MEIANCFYLIWNFLLISLENIFKDCIFLSFFPSAPDNMCLTCKTMRNSLSSLNSAIVFPCHSGALHCEHSMLHTDIKQSATNTKAENEFRIGRYFFFFSWVVIFLLFRFVSYDTSICIERTGISKWERKTNTFLFWGE